MRGFLRLRRNRRILLYSLALAILLFYWRMGSGVRVAWSPVVHRDAAVGPARRADSWDQMGEGINYPIEAAEETAALI